MAAMDPPGAWQIGAWIADPAADTLMRGSESVKIEPRLMRLLLALAESPGQVLSQEKLLAEVWAGVVVGPASVYQNVSQLRKVLGDSGSPPTYIETVARKGYRMIAPVSRNVTLLPVTTGQLPPASVAPDGNAALATSASPASPVAPANAVIAPRSWLHRRRWTVSLGSTALILLAIAAFYWSRPGSAAAASIAVLPFIDLSSDKTEQPFCDGVTEELSNSLAQLPTLKVVARSSASVFRDRQTDVREIGRELGTTHVLEGSLRRVGNVLRLTVQLIATRDGYNLWSGQFDAAASEVIRVQEEVAHQVASNLELRLTDATNASLHDRSSSSAQAYTTYLVARHHAQLLTREDNERSIELYRQSIQLDPSFALARVGLAHAWLNQRYFNDRPIESIAGEASVELERAHQLAPRLPDLYVVRGALETELHQQQAAIRDLQRAAQLNPNSREAASELGFYYLVNGEPRSALDYYTRATNLDPLAATPSAQRCLAFADLGLYDGAAAACERARTLDPQASWAYVASSAFEQSRGQLAPALGWNTVALARNGQTQELYVQRSELFAELGLIDQVRESCDTAILATRATEPNARLTGLILLAEYAAHGSEGLQRRIAAEHWDVSPDFELLFEVANAELLAGQFKAARDLVERALASPDLTPDQLNSPWLARNGHSYLLIAAAAHQATGDVAKAARELGAASQLLTRLQSAGMQRYGLSDLQAQIEALRGNPDAAMGALQHAASLGWHGAWLAEHEPFFQGLRARADFRALLQRAQAQNAATARALRPEDLATPAPAK